jgi:hypothetical protein
LVFPTTGDKIFPKELETPYVGEFTKDTISLNGISGLWIFGKYGQNMGDRYGQNVVSRLPKLTNMNIRIAKYRSHLYFNHRCKENKVLPFSLRFKPPIRSKKGYKLMENTVFSFLRLRIDDCHQFIQRLRSDCQRLLGELSDLIDCSEVLWIEEFCRSQFSKESIKQREKHDKNLLRLIGTKPSDKSSSNL